MNSENHLFGDFFCAAIQKCAAVGIAAAIVTGIVFVPYQNSCAKENVHHLEWIQVKEADCYLSGEEVQKCTDCGKEFDSREIPRLGHKYEDCKCLRCGNRIAVDEENKALFLTKKIMKEAGIIPSGYVEIPDTVTYNNEEYCVVGLDRQLFDGNESVTSIYVPDGVWYIGDFAFNKCSALKNVSLPDSVTYIGKAAFQLCTSLEHISLPENLEFLGGFGFNHCSGILDEEVVIGQHVKQIGSLKDAPAHMFYDFGKDGIFRQFTVSEDNPNYKSEDGILYSKDGSLLVSIPRGKEFSNGVFVMPNTVTDLGELSFSRNLNIQTVVISDKLSVDAEVKSSERRCYNNFGNDLSRAIYVYCPVRKYETKETNEKYQSIDGVLYSADGTQLVAVPNKYNRALQIPKGVEVWNDQAVWTDLDEFEGMIYNEIPSISIPASLSEIEGKQMETINYMVSNYGTEIFLAEGNQAFQIDGNGYLIRT